MGEGAGAGEGEGERLLRPAAPEQPPASPGTEPAADAAATTTCTTMRRRREDEGAGAGGAPNAAATRRVVAALTYAATSVLIMLVNKSVLYVWKFPSASVLALAQFSVTPALDFDLDPEIQQLDAVSKPVSESRKADVLSSSLYQSFTQKHQAHLIESKK